ncbi:MAG: hypothetical protein QXF69_05920 [Thermofilaceae archaeon]
MKNMKWDVVVRCYERRTAEPLYAGLFVHYDYDECVAYSWYAARNVIIACHESDEETNCYGEDLEPFSDLHEEVARRVKVALIDEITGRGLFTAKVIVNDEKLARLIEKVVEELKARYPPK